MTTSISPCSHNNQTLCRFDDPTWGTFVAYQCDDCGMVTRRDVTADDLDLPDLPYIDEPMWLRAISSATDNVFGQREYKTLCFFGRAVRR